MRRVWVLVLLTNCGQLTEGFNRGFNKSFRESCLTAAMKKGAGMTEAERYCDCALVKFKESRSMDKAAEACAPK